MRNELIYLFYELVNQKIIDDKFVLYFPYADMVFFKIYLKQTHSMKQKKMCWITVTNYHVL